MEKSRSLWKELKPRSRGFRESPTTAEAVLWEELRSGKIDGFRFRRQHAIWRFIVDFYCARAGLAIEVDGPIHREKKESDATREQFLKKQGLRVLRFSNEEVLQSLDKVLATIKGNLPKFPSPKSERG